MFDLFIVFPERDLLDVILLDEVLLFIEDLLVVDPLSICDLFNEVNELIGDDELLFLVLKVVFDFDNVLDTVDDCEDLFVIVFLFITFFPESDDAIDDVDNAGEIGWSEEEEDFIELLLEDEKLIVLLVSDIIDEAVDGLLDFGVDNEDDDHIELFFEDDKKL